MKKNDLHSDEIWASQPFESGEGAAALSPEGMRDTLFRDDGDLYPLALDASSVFTVDVYAPKPVASIATLADYLVNGFWQYNSTIAHHWASNTISYNITGLNSAEQFLALGDAGVVRGRQRHLRADLRRREHHVHPQRHDAGLYQRLMAQWRDRLSDRQHQLRLDHQ